MDLFVVEGGVPLRGVARVSGAKNAALPIMAAALMADGPTRLADVPDLADVASLASLLRTLGVDVHRSASGSMELEVVSAEPCVAHYDLVRKMRASICVLGPLLARRGRACVSLPGGCNIGDRPIDLHLKGLRALGADIRIERGYVVAEADRLRGCPIYLGGPFGSTVTGTCNVMAAAVLADGTTTIESAACEPEVVNLGRSLNAMGARISGLGTPFLKIEGVERLSGVEVAIIPDRIEAATLMIAAAITGGELLIENVCLDDMTAVVETLRQMNVRIEEAPAAARSSETIPFQSLSVGAGLGRPNRVRVSVPGTLRGVDCTALPYPGLPTDVQAQIMALLTRAEGISVVTDKVFPDRFLHLPELVRLGARIRREGSTAIISGGSRLSGANLMASDLRASAALVLAALAAEGTSVIRRIYHLDRGYERLDEKLACLGAIVRRMKDEPTERTDAAPPPMDESQPLPSPLWSRRRAG